MSETAAAPPAQPPAKAKAKGAAARKPPPGRKGGFGRQKGTPNKATREVKELIRRFLTDPDYQDNLMDRVQAGDAPFMEKYLWELAFGRPKVVVENVGDVPPGTTVNQVILYLPRNGREVDPMKVVDIPAGAVRELAAAASGLPRVRRRGKEETPGPPPAR